MISAKFVPLKYYTLSAQLRRLTSFFSWVFGSANSVIRPDRRNAKMVYSSVGMGNDCRSGATGGQGATAPLKVTKKRKKKRKMGYFHALKLAFLSS